MVETGGAYYYLWMHEVDLSLPDNSEAVIPEKSLAGIQNRVWGVATETWYVSGSRLKYLGLETG